LGIDTDRGDKKNPLRCLAGKWGGVATGFQRPGQAGFSCFIPGDNTRRTK